MNRKSIVAVLLVSVFLCTSCALLPKEEVLPDPPELVVNAKEYTLIPVTRGDLTLTYEKKCTYQSSVQETLSFSVVGEPISTIFVKKGDAVTAGTLVAELESSSLREQLEATQKTLDSLTVQIAQTEERLGLYYEKCSALETAAAADPMYEFQLESAQRTCLRLYNDLEFLKKDQAVEQMALDELSEQLKARQLFAGMDGIVSSVLQLDDTRVQKSFLNQSVCVISDMSTGRFVAMVDKGTLKTGSVVSVIYDDMEHSGKVTSVTPGEKKKSPDSVEIQLDIADETLPAGMAAQLVAILGERKDVLLLPRQSVDTFEDGKSAVYYLDESGVRHAKDVEVGLVADNMAEIVSGLEEGELVVK